MRAMPRFVQDDLGRCDFIDVLEEAVLRRRPVEVQLRTGETFTDQLVDVHTEGGDDFAVFRAHARVAVGELASLRSPATAD
jgi:transcriptional antiterminator Rof (Rho-off)